MTTRRCPCYRARLARERSPHLSVSTGTGIHKEGPVNTPRPAAFALRITGALLVAFALLVLSSIPALAQSPWIITDSSPYSLGATATNLQSEYYRVEQWGFLFTRTTFWHDVWYYPTPNERHEASVFFIDAHNTASGDFNGDGKKDLMINWGVFPHTVERPVIAPSVLLNNGSGGLVLSPSSWLNGTGPGRLFSYRSGTADFNHDGFDDFVAATGGIHTTHATGAITQIFEPIPLALSSADGRLFDATTYVAGQESGGFEPELRSAHNLAIGDVNGDGHKDFFQANFLFVNDGTGHFAARQDLLPPEASSLAKRIMSSASADLDNDGVEDLVIAYFDGQHSAEGSGYIFLSNGTGGIVNGRKVLLPPGLFGLQTTKHNFMTICDLNRDGLKDIVIAQTRTNPYYGGRTLQVLMNKGNGQFVDETGQRIHGNNDRHDDQSFLSGEGVLYCQDLNGDGYLDLFDSLLGPLHNNFNRAFLNNGRGVLHAMPSSIIPIVHPYHMQGREHFKGEPYGTSNYYRLIPIDLNGDGRVSFLAVHNHTPDYWPLLPGDAVEATYYIIRNIKPYTLPSPFVASVLPSSRSVEVGVPATAFATIINTGSSTATDCGIAPITDVPANFVYQATNPATNQIIGAPNTSVTIAPGAAQSFVFAFTPTAPMASTDVKLRLDCADSSLAPINPGLNTLLFSVSSTPVPDIVALAATPANDGIVNVLGANGAGAFAVATVNVGASGNITASADTGSAILPVNISLCQTDPATGQCISAIGSTVMTTINANGTPTFGIFVQGNGNVHFDPAFNRVFVRFTDASGVTRGSSVAIRTQ